jgi:[ribosomal protein S5]-alanine N-acetyltransferase
MSLRVASRLRRGSQEGLVLDGQSAHPNKRNMRRWRMRLARPGSPMASENQWPQMLPLESPRLVLRRFTSGDVEPFLAYRNDPVVARWQGWDSLSLAEATEFVARQQKQGIARPGRWLQIAITLKQSGQLIGDCALKVHKADKRQATIGITLSRAGQGQGFATEALSALLDYVFLRGGLHRVQADTDVKNTSAWKLLERLGMRREAHCRESLWFKGQWADEFLYATFCHEWLNHRKQASCDR